MATPSIDNGFLIEGLECECDGADDGAGRCGNHDDNAEVAYWYSVFSQPIPVVDITAERADRVHDGREHKYAEAWT